MNKRKELLLAVLGIIGVLVITIAVTYAFFTYTKEGTTENTITTGKITFLYTETSFGRGIKLENAMPLSDIDGKKQIGDRNVFDFKITADTTNNVAIPYDVTVVKQSESDLEESDVKIYIAEVNANVEEYGKIGKFNDDSKFPKYNGSNIERIIYKGKVPSNKEGYIQNLRLKMWISEDAEFSPLKDNDGNYIIENDDYVYPNNNKTFKVKVNVYANGGVITDTEVAQESQASMLSLKVGEEPLTEKTAGSKLYETILPSGTTETEVEVGIQSEYQKVKIEKTESDYSTVIGMNNDARIERMTATKKITLPLTAGDNYFKITITPEDGKSDSKIYKLHISVKEFIRIFGKVYEIATDTPNFKNKYDGVGKLYKSTETNSGNPTYYFRGAVTNNWVSFAGFKWRIVRINEDNSIRLIMQDGINNNEKYKIHSAQDSENYMYYTNWTESNGYLKKALQSWYSTNIANKTIPGTDNKYSTNVSVSKDGGYFCEQPKAKVDNDWTSGITGINMKYFNNYEPNYKCEAKGGYGKVNSNIGLITYDELLMAGGCFGPSTSNYYLKNGTYFWTMSAAGIKDSAANVWYVDADGGFMNSTNVKNSASVRPVINLDKNTTITKGNGTESSPFLITGSPEI